MERSESRDAAGQSGAIPGIAGIPEPAIARFCDAIEFGVHDTAPSEGELELLRETLRDIARDAHAAALPPEQLLIGLKGVWTRVCQRDPGPDLRDATWDLVVRESLDAYEWTRP